MEGTENRQTQHFHQTTNIRNSKQQSHDKLPAPTKRVFTNKKTRKSYGKDNYFNHFRFLLYMIMFRRISETERTQKIYQKWKNINKPRQKRLPFKRRDKQRGKRSTPDSTTNILHHYKPEIRARFPNSTFPSSTTNSTWATVTYINEAERDPLRFLLIRIFNDNNTFHQTINGVQHQKIINISYSSDPSFENTGTRPWKQKRKFSRTTPTQKPE